MTKLVVGIIVAVVVVTTAVPLRAAEKLDFNRDVRKILSDKCFKCHGPDPNTLKAGLRLDSFEAATKPGEAGKSGALPIVPGNPDESEVVRRIFHDDPDEMMPPPENKNPLTDAQKNVLRRWIAEGATYEPHWAFAAPVRSALPVVKDRGWLRNGIDAFVLDRLEREGMKPSAEADRYTLVRRLYLDLIGLPPTPAEVDAFVNDSSPDAYERLVDRLVDSPAYGERWARRWLDLARYADTNGYEKDRPRSMWPYRDWVIGAINSGMPFDQFTVEQIAGDMLPGATAEQVIATGFHRNTMINEEGGIDPMEFRFYSLVDRVATTGTVWLGLTVGCSQCHTHKYDPLMHREFYGMMAFFDQADEPKVEVVDPQIAATRAKTEREIAATLADLPNRFPVPGPLEWAAMTPPPGAAMTTAGGAALSPEPDGSLIASGAVPEKDTYTITIETPATEVAAIRLEALADPRLPGQGPGRAANGNFVLSEITISAAPLDQPDSAQPVKLAKAEADFSQEGFPVANAIDGNAGTGWAIADPKGKTNVNRTATFHFEQPVTFPGGAGMRLTITLSQQHGAQHLLGRLRLAAGVPVHDERPVEIQRREHLNRKFNEWVAAASAKAVRWTVLRPTKMHTALAYMDLLPDGSVLASGDQSKLDVYELTYENPGVDRITAVRLEAMPHHSLPEGGPGRIYYEGPLGDFYLSDMKLTADGTLAKWGQASESFAVAKGFASAGALTAAGVIDDKTETGWSVQGGQGLEHRAVFTLAQPVVSPETLDIKMTFERWYAAALGRFRISVTSDPVGAPSADLPADVEAILATAAEKWTAAERDRVWRHYLSIAPELAGEREKIETMRKQMPLQPTTLAMRQRDPQRYRQTKLHNRGEFLKPVEAVPPIVPEVLHPITLEERVPTRLDFARWLVDERNPLVARVTMNRDWAAFFGRGIVRTVDDFGVQGEPPTHPQLLDYLATEFMRTGWSVKRMHRLIVTSATYRQSSVASDDSLRVDPDNKLLARAPRLRLEAELIRDSALRAAGLLTWKIGGSSVFPPQPPGITESTYGPLKWIIATDQERYRRGLYTFAKRTAPYAMFSLFGAPSGEACEARRVRANTPLQALTMLNDTAFVEAAQAMARAVLAAGLENDEQRATELFRRVMVRPPGPTELRDLLAFYSAQAQRFRDEPSLASQICGREDATAEQGAWTAVARVVLNLDEAITKE